jgi:V8-like Glu-specific endopeptidase
MASEEERFLDLLRRKVDEIAAAEGPGFERAPPTARAGIDPALRGVEAAGGRPESAQLEAIVQWHRPVLWIRSDQFPTGVGDATRRDFAFTDPNDRSSPEILAMLEQRRPVLSPAIPAIGRIEVLNNAQYEWVGTGWVVACDLGHDIVITNAHVATEFAQRSGSGFVFRRGTTDFSRPQSARIDFREEISEAAAREFAVTDVVWISDNEILDIGILRVATRAGEDRLSGPIRLAPELAVAGRNVAVIGYPGDDSRSYDAEKFRRLFGNVFGKKRLAPGRLMDPHEWGLRHDCSTLPGNSGSVVLDIDTGAALGLHYSGTMFRANYAVPAAELARVMRQRPWQQATEVRVPPLVDNRSLTSTTTTSSILAGGDGGFTLAPDGAVRLVLPLEITVKLGLPGGATLGKASVTAGSAESAAAQVKQQLAQQPNVLTVKADYLFRDGLITDDLGVIVRVAPGASTDPATYGLGSHFGGIEVSVETADPETIIADRIGPVREAFGGRRARYERDLRDPRFNLDPVTDEMNITLHVSPEAGWPMLKPFLAENRFEQFTVGMYHMTAPHVVAAIKAIAGRNNSRVTLSIDRQRGEASPPDDTGEGTKVDDIAESQTLDELETIAGNRFKWAEASLGGNALFASAYHIKVAVWSDRVAGGRLRDKKFWLSSGNWQSSNQAPVDKPIEQLRWDDIADYNREWHAIVEHAGLAATFRNHLEQDFKDNEAAARTEARRTGLPDVILPRGLLERPPRPSEFEAFRPLELNGRIKVQPLLTPDNYPEVVAKLIANARERVLIENQSFSLWSEPKDTPAHFLKIVEAVRDRQRAGLDVRIIFRSGFGNERESLRRLKKFKMKVGPDHIRFFDTCHTKGIVIDNDIAVLGSHNWTAGGTGPNRDASLVIWDRRANAYFAKLFEYDWRQVARNRIRLERVIPESVRFIPAGAETTLPDGYQRISLSEFLGET